MAKVIIDGIEYVPRAAIPELTDERLHNALKELVSIQYFASETHKHRAKAWDALYALAPELAELASDNPQAAYERIHAGAAE